MMVKNVKTPNTIIQRYLLHLEAEPFAFERPEMLVCFQKLFHVFKSDLNKVEVLAVPILLLSFLLFRRLIRKYTKIVK